MTPIRVLVVDDSAFMRHAIGRMLGEADGIEVVGSAPDGEQGLRLAAALRPDVITLDVEMPVLDGLGMLKRLMREAPTRVVMLSSLTVEGAAVTLDALDAGAIDFVPKPSGSLSVDVGRVQGDLVAKVRAAASMSEATFLRHRQQAIARLAARPSYPAAPPAPFVALPRRPAAAIPSPAASSRPLVASRRLVVIAASTGGPGALMTLVSGLPPRLGAAVIIVQHMPPGFTASLAARLDAGCALPVSEAAGGEVLADDRILIAPGDRHLISASSGHVQLVHLPPVNGVRPAADVTMQAVAPAWRERLLGVVLTGMGYDGREGARAIKQHGGTIFAQDEATATIYGMPAAVADAHLADEILPLQAVAGAIARWCGHPVASASAGGPGLGAAAAPGIAGR